MQLRRVEEVEDLVPLVLEDVLELHPPVRDVRAPGLLPVLIFPRLDTALGAVWGYQATS